MNRLTPLLLLWPLYCPASLIWNAPNDVRPDTLLLYHLDGTGTTLLDATGTYNGTLADAAARAGQAAEWLATPAGDFLAPSGNPSNGMNANVSITGVDFNQGLTISFWYRALAGVTQGGELFQIEGPRTRIVTDDFGTSNNGRLRLMANGTNGNLISFGASNVWRHVAVVYDPINLDASDGGQWLFYLDNEVVDTLPDVNDLSSDTGFTLRVGNNTFNNGPLQGGQIDEFLVANSVISDFSGPAVIPEPKSFLLLLLGLTFWRRR